MAPGRKRNGAKGGKNNQLSLGDLVLAKVKGFPAWPAKISKPEDWKRTPDPRKYFVQFFGTEEIAFVAPVDIQPFTSESKDKLLIRCKGKTVKYFSKAVKEICDTFEESENKSSDSLKDDDDGQASQPDADFIQMVDDVMITDGPSCATSSNEIVNYGPGLERCSHTHSEMGYEDVNPSVSPFVNDCSPSLSTKQQAEFCNDDITLLKLERISTSDAGHNTNSKTGSHVESNEQKSKKIAKASKNNHDDVANLESGEDIRKTKKNLKDKTHVGLTDNLSKDIEGTGKKLQKDNGVLQPAKKSKFLDEVPKKSQILRKNDVSCKGGYEEVKKAIQNLKTKNHSVQNGNLGDEEVAQPTKRRRMVLEDQPEDRKSESSVTTKKGKDTGSVKSGPQMHMKKRAVLIFDEDEDEPKTPVHGRSSKVVDKVSHTLMPGEEVAVVTEVIQDSPGLRENVNVKESVPKSRQDTSEVVEGKLLHTPGKSGSEKRASEEILKGFVSPIKSPFEAYTKMVEPSTVNKTSGNASGNISQKKGQSGSFNPSTGIYEGGHHFQKKVVNERIRPVISGEKQKTTPKSSSRVMESTVLRKPSDNNLLYSERSETRAVHTTSLSDSRNADSNNSMRHLIAVAQAKRKQAQPHNLVHESINFPLAETIGKSPDSISAVQQITTGHGIMARTDDQIDSAEFEERRTSSGHRPAGGSLSGGTEAAVARDAFEGMIETLSRTKESIGRATRHAIDCAKHGIANEVVEILTRKLESESSFHRRVDLFFLVDSITQCSHSQKGIAGASYIPTVQAALPRLLGAAAPPGANARENRRQCLKILKLWLERKILPDTLLRSYIEAIGSSNDTTSAAISSKRQPRSEQRAVDDPIREMEGMLVDEYGSNATFQLPGLLSSNVFEEDDDDILNFSHKEHVCKSTIESNTAIGELETCSVTSNERRHCILEDVDGELEMEDVSGHPKDESFLAGDRSCKAVHEDEGFNRTMDTASNNSIEVSPFREGSPPLPPDSPPPTPPLPSSPPPPLSPPMAPPPPSTPSPPPPPPPIPPSQVYPLHVGPPQVFSQPSMLPMPSYVPVNSRLGTHVDSAVRAEMFSQQPSSFLVAVPTSVHIQGSQSNQQYQSGNVRMPLRTFQTPILNQTAAGQFKYPNPATMQHPYAPLYGLTKPPDGPRRYGGDEQWRPPLNDGQRGAWLSYGRTSLSAAPSIVQEGYFRPPMERPPTNKITFQPVGQNIVSAGSPNPGQSGPLMMPSSLNSWRPA